MSDLLTSPTGTHDVLAALDPEEIPVEYERLGLDRLSDGELVGAAGMVLAAPKLAPADSFVLHAPLELLARYGLLRQVTPTDRRAARERIVRLASTFARTGDAVPAPARLDIAPAATIAERLGAAVSDGDLDETDRLVGSLAGIIEADQLAPLLTDAVLPRLSAAAHAPIALHLFPRVAASGEVSLTMLRGTVRELARHPEALLTWPRSLAPPSPLDRTAELGGRIGAVVATEQPEVSFVWPTMTAAEESGRVAAVLEAPLEGEVDLAEARRQILRTAAHSMLQDDPDHAPYGWSHALTLPQAVLSVAPHAHDLRVAVATAATYVVGFRAAFGTTPLDLEFVPSPIDVPLADAIAAGPHTAASAAWHHDPVDRSSVRTALASWASAREDAHLVKYTLACFDAAAADPAAAPLFLAAAAHLAGWWAQLEG